ncbi:putative fructose-2,6-bisphosphatase [Plasmopara halstedii]
MVGLPARGKSLLPRNYGNILLERLKCQVFNVGQLRRATSFGKKQDHSFLIQIILKRRKSERILHLRY